MNVIIIGAGACGLMAARELSKNGNKVVILEARDRIGGRILPLSQKEFGYPAQGGAEFVHGPAKITHSSINEANLTYRSVTDGELWQVQHGKLSKDDLQIPFQNEIHQRLKKLTDDTPIATFLDLYFREEKYD